HLPLAVADPGDRTGEQRHGDLDPAPAALDGWSRRHERHRGRLGTFFECLAAHLQLILEAEKFERLEPEHGARALDVQASYRRRETQERLPELRHVREALLFLLRQATLDH